MSEIPRGAVIDASGIASLANGQSWSAEYAKGWCEGFSMMAAWSWNMQTDKERQMAAAFKYDGWEEVVDFCKTTKPPPWFEGDVWFVKDGRAIFKLDPRDGTMTAV